ncbi:trypsin-like peptidase domain-containing protein [Candidatus Berkelbacteria bacterium]|nr:trypsin-like peptidase domain-containing protein [Candidatus Berkelbacteria bacterium]
MPAITYLDEGPEIPPGTNSIRTIRQHRPRGGFIVLFLFLSLLMGFLGSVAGFLLLTNDAVATKLGLNTDAGIDLGLGKTERVVLEESSKVIDSVAKVSPAVVSISTTRNIQDLFGRMIEQKGGGTGFIITSDGLIVTNKHVVSETGATYTVFTSDGRDFEAKVLAQDPLNDLAVVKIEATGLPVVELGSSTDLKIGQHVIAIGNALGEFNNSVTLGVISAKERQITAAGGGVEESLSGLLQTDAAINPGNSGGPLVNLSGQVVGINTAVAGGAENIGFAIPIDVVKKAIESIKATGEIKRPMLGVRYIPVTKELAKVNQLPADYGVWVLPGSTRGDVAVLPGSPADKAGLEENDIITEINDQRVDENHTLVARLADFKPGDKVTLTVIQAGETKKIEVTLGELEAN